MRTEVSPGGPGPVEALGSTQLTAWRLPAVLLVALLTGCAATQEKDSQGSDEKSPTAKVSEEMAASAEAQGESGSDGGQAPPEGVREELMPSLELEAPDQGNEEPRFDIDVREAPARAFFNSLVEGTPYNMVVHPDVEGTISINLKNVTIPEIMATVRKVYGYDFARSTGGYIVRPRRMQSRIYEVDYLNLNRSGRSATRVSSGELSDSEGNDNGGSGSNDSNSGGSSSDNSQSVATSIRTKTESDVWEDLARGVRTIVGDEGERSVVVSPQSSMVVVRAMPDELREVAKFLGESEASLSRQVVLEAKILEVELAEGFRSGINYSVLSEQADGDVILGSQTGGGQLLNDRGRGSLGDGASAIAGQTGDLDPRNTNQINNALTSSFGGAFSAAFNLGDFSAFIELLETQGDVQVLSSPRVSTVNNQKAVIKVGTDEFFATDIDNDQTTTGDVVTNSPDVELTPFFSGIALDVTPQISDAREVTLHVHPTVSEVQDQRKDFTVGGQGASVPLALSTVRESDSIVRAKSGQIVVIGGLMQEKIEEETAGVPLLSDLPFVGGAFEQRRERRGKTELVILLKPNVIESSEDWQGPLQESSERIQRMRRDKSEAGEWDKDRNE